MILMIVNPTAGHGKATRLAEKATALLEPCQVVHTTAPGHATELARQAAESGQYDVVAAVGGDGTVSEVAAGLRGTPVPLGILPAGTGNDTCRSYGIPLDLEAAASVLQGGRMGDVDILRVNGQIFLNIMSVGFDAQVVKAAQQYKRFGSISYAMGVYAALAHYRYTDLALTVDGVRQEGRYYLATAGCGSHYGGGMRVLPMADPCDGLLDLCTIDPVPMTTVIRLLPRFMKGQHTRYDYVHFTRARHIVMEALGDGCFDLNADGEVQPGHRRVEIEVVPGGQRVILPEKRGGNEYA